MKLLSLIPAATIFFVSCSKQPPRMLPLENNPDSIVVVARDAIIIKKVIPRWPAHAREAGLSAHIFVSLLVGIDGKPERVLIRKVKSEPPITYDMNDNPVRADLVWHEPVIEAAMKFRFKPAENEAGQPVRTWTMIPFVFLNRR